MRRLVGTVSALALVIAGSPAYAQMTGDEETQVEEVEPEPEPEPAPQPQPQPQPQPDLDVNVEQPDVQVTPAQQQPMQQDVNVNVVEVEEDELGYDPFVPYGMSLSVGGGILDFTDENMRDMTGVAGAWEVRATWGLSLPVAAELSYTGAAQEIDALGLDNDADLLTSAFEVMARINILQDMGGIGGLQPYVAGGLGWTRFDLINVDVNVSSVDDDDNALSIPLAAGVSYRWGRVLGDLRGTYRPMADEDLAPLGPPDQNDSSDLDSWSVTLRVGAVF